MLPNIYTTHFALTAHLMRLLALIPTNKGKGFNNNFFYVFLKFFFFCTSVIFLFLYFCKLSLQISHQRLLTL